MGPEQTSPAGRAQYVPSRTLVVCEGAAWRDLFVQVFTHGSVQQPFLVPAVAEPHLAWVTSGSATVEERDLDGDGAWRSTRVGVGDFYLTHSLTPYELRWTAEEMPFEALDLYLSIPLLERVAREVTGAPHLQLAEISGGHDDRLGHILALLHDELLTRSPGNALVVEGLAQSLAVHLIRRYAVAGEPTAHQSALPGAKLRRAIAFMTRRLDEPFELGAVARAAGLSAFHFSRMFKRSTGFAPSRYFIRLRVAKAQQLLQETEASVLEVGAAVGYTNPSHFATVFRRETGVLPNEYRRR